MSDLPTYADNAYPCSRAVSILETARLRGGSLCVELQPGPPDALAYDECEAGRNGFLKGDALSNLGSCWVRGIPSHLDSVFIGKRCPFEQLLGFPGALSSRFLSSRLKPHSSGEASYGYKN